MELYLNGTNQEIVWHVKLQRFSLFPVFLPSYADYKPAVASFLLYQSYSTSIARGPNRNITRGTVSVSERNYNALILLFQYNLAHRRSSEGNCETLLQLIIGHGTMCPCFDGIHVRKVRHTYK